MFDFLEDNLLIVCPSSYKKAILTYLTKNKLVLDIKFITMEEYIKKRKFDYDIKTIHYLVNKGLKVSNAKNYLENILYLEDKEYEEEKLVFLQKLKKELDENNLLIYDPFFCKMMEKRKVIIYGYGKLDKYQLSLFYHPTIIDYNEINHHFDVYYLENIDDEVEMVFQKIIDLLRRGIDINQISLMNIDSEYLPLIKKYSFFYQIPIESMNEDTLIGTEIGKYFLELVKEKKTREEIFLALEKYQNNDNYKLLVNLLNKYVDYHPYEVIREIKEELETIKVITKNYENVIRIKNLYDYVSEDEYIFLLNFNNPSIPKLSLDIDYITDNIKDLVGLPKTEEKNLLIKENTLNYLKSIHNLIISYKKNTAFDNYYPSILLDEMDYTLKEYQRSLNYSILANKDLYAKYLDDYVKYGLKNADLEQLYLNYDTNDFMTYDNAFKPFASDKILKHLNNELALSYTSIDTFYKCSFRYYLNEILKINVFEENFFGFIGTLFHDVLRHMNDSDFNFEKQYLKNLEGKEFTSEEKFFLDKLKSDLLYVIEVIKKHQFIMGFSENLYERKIDIPIKNSPYVHFKGFVDKIVYKENNNETLVSVIDYKTNNPNIEIKNLQFGLSMQLPVYLYLIKNSHLFKNPHFAGFYLQHILNNNIKKDKHTVEEQKMNNLKLMGYTTSNLLRMSIFDSTYENSEMIYGLKLNKDGTLPKRGNYLSDEEIDAIIALTEEKIINAMEEILNSRFAINPKILKQQNVSCKYCQYQSICYLEDKNFVYLKGDETDESDAGTEISDL